MRKLIFTTITLMCVVFSLTAQGVNDNEAKRQLLRNLESSRHDTVRLEIMVDLVNMTRSNPSEGALYAEKLLREAEQQRRVAYICRAYVDLVGLVGVEDLSQAQQYLALLIELASVSNQPALMIQGKLVFAKLQYASKSQQQEEAYLKILKEAREIDTKEGIVHAFRALAAVYEDTGRYDEASNRYEEAYNLSRTTDNVKLSLDINNDIVELHKEQKDMKVWLESIIKGDELIESQVALSTTARQKLMSQRLRNYIRYVEYYVATEQLTQAAKYLALATNLQERNLTLSQHDLLMVSVDYCMMVKDYEKALTHIDELIMLTRSAGSKNYSEILLAKADVLGRLSKDKEAAQTYRQALSAIDSLVKSRHSVGVEKIKRAYKITSLEYDIRKLIRHDKLVLGVGAAVIFVMFLFFLVKMLRMSKRRKKAEIEVMLLKAKMRQTHETTDKFLSNITQAVRPPVVSILESARGMLDNDGMASPDIARAGNYISKTSDSVVKQISEIVDMSRLDIGMMQFHVHKVDLAVMLRDAISMVAERGVTVSYITPEITLCITKIDGDRFFQVLRSLMSKVDEECNHISVMMESKRVGSVSITVSGAALAAKNRSDELAISNEINKMFVSYFGGDYEIESEMSPPYIRITLPAEKVERLYM